MMDPNHKLWNARHQTLREFLKRPANHYPEVIDLFLTQHAAVHARAVSGTEDWSFEEETWDGLTEDVARCVVGDHSIAWVYWHLARIEDMTMNVLVAGTEQVFNPEWQARLAAPDVETGNAMPAERIAAFSACVDLAALRDYHIAVGTRTRAIAQALTPAELRRKAPPERIERLRSTGHVLPDAAGLLDYWGGLAIGGLLLMPPTRHCFLHFNEAKRIRAALR